MLAHGVQRLGCLAVFQADAGQRAEAVRLDEDLAFLALLRADLRAEVVVGAQEPLAIPAVLVNHAIHLGGFAEIRGGLGVQSAAPGDGRQFAAGMDEQPGDEDRLGDFAVLVGGGLEALPRRVGEAVQVQAVVPVGAANQRQAVRPKAVPACS